MMTSGYGSPFHPDPFFVANLVLLLVLWLPWVIVLDRVLPWAFGAEAVAPWTGRRRRTLLLGIAAASTAALCVLGFCSAYGRGDLDLLDKRIYVINPARFWAWYTTRPRSAWEFNFTVFLFGLLELTFALLVLMGVKLHGKWARRRTSEAERELGLSGVIAWLGGPNLVWAVMVTACVTLFFAAAFNGPRERGGAIAGCVAICAALTLGTLAAFPLLRTARAPARPRAATDAFTRTPADLSSERQRVLRLLEDARITADEAAELLAALAATVSPEGPSAGPVTRSRQSVLVGAALVLVGFFLPWFRISPMAELERALGISGASISSGFPAEAMLSTMRVNGRPVPFPSDGRSAETMIVSVAGGDVAHGLGWLILAGALAAAVMPYVATGLSPPAQRRAAWLAAGVAMLLAVYLLTQSFSAASFGLALAIFGLGVQWAGLIADLPRRPPTTAAVAMAG